MKRILNVVGTAILLACCGIGCASTNNGESAIQVDTGVEGGYLYAAATVGGYGPEVGLGLKNDGVLTPDDDPAPVDGNQVVHEILADAGGKAPTVEEATDDLQKAGLWEGFKKLLHVSGRSEPGRIYGSVTILGFGPEAYLGLRSPPPLLEPALPELLPAT